MKVTGYYGVFSIVKNKRSEFETGLGDLSIASSAPFVVKPVCKLLQTLHLNKKMGDDNQLCTYMSLD